MIIPPRVWEETARHYAARTAQRDGTLEQIEAGRPPEAVDSPDRVAPRRQLLARARLPAKTRHEDRAAPPAVSSEAAAAPYRLGQERILGQSDRMSVNLLDAGIEVARRPTHPRAHR